MGVNLSNINININGQAIKTNEQGFLLHLDDWSEEYAEEIARIDNIYLFTDHWELI